MYKFLNDEIFMRLSMFSESAQLLRVQLAIIAVFHHSYINAYKG